MWEELIMSMPIAVGKPVSSQVDNLYCARCGKTTRHKKVGDQYECPCGAVKKAIARRLDEALGLVESADKPVMFKHEGLRKKSQAGAHRFDKGVDYSQMEFDGKWGTKSKQDKLGA